MGNYVIGKTEMGDVTDRENPKLNKQFSTNPNYGISWEQYAEEIGRPDMDLETFMAFPHALVGSVDYMCEELERRRELYGFSYVSIGRT